MSACAICGGLTPLPKKRGCRPKYCSDACRLVARGEARRVLRETQPDRVRERNRNAVVRWRAGHRDSFKRSRRKSYARHKDSYLARRRSYVAARREKERERARARYAANKLRTLARQKAYRADERRKEQARLKTAAWRVANTERAREASRRYQKEHPEAAHKSTSTRRARKIEAFVEAVDPLVVFERDKGRCGVCRKPVKPESKWHVDHVIPLVRGGAHCYDNVQLTHARCNQSKHAQLPKGQPTLFQVIAS